MAQATAARTPTSASATKPTAFAVAALSYSHAISDVARALRHVWLAAGGSDPRQRLAERRDSLLVVEAGAGR